MSNPVGVVPTAGSCGTLHHMSLLLCNQLELLVCSVGLLRCVFLNVFELYPLRASFWWMIWVIALPCNSYMPHMAV
jgi:hypothetical protein